MTFQLDNDLSAVNSVLAAIGQAPVTDLNYQNPEVAMVKRLIDEVTVDVQSEEWQFNTEDHREFTPETAPNGDRQFIFPSGALRMNLSGGQIYRMGDLVVRGNRMYNKLWHTTDVREWKDFSSPWQLYFDMVWNLPFDELPPIFQRYITLRASQRAAAQLVSNADLVKLLEDQVNMARSACIEYDCNQGNNSFFGWPDHTAYNSYQPFRTLAR